MESTIVSPFRNNEILAITEEGYRHLLAEMAAGKPSRERPRPAARGGVAVIPIHGTTTFFDSWFGVNTQRIGDTVEAAADSKGISSIVLDIASPGGMAYGNIELSDRILAAGARKRIVAIANPLAASAAYWIGSAANKFYVTPSGDGGSIGTYTTHIDESEMYKRMGVKVTLIKAGKHKAEGNSFEPLSQDSHKYIQNEVNEINQSFVSSVARNRGVTVQHVEDHFGQGRVMIAKRAVAAGLFDGIRTLPSLIADGTSSRYQDASRATYANEKLTDMLNEAWHNGYASRSEHMTNYRRDQLIQQRQDQERLRRIQQRAASVTSQDERDKQRAQEITERLTGYFAVERRTI